MQIMPESLSLTERLELMVRTSDDEIDFTKSKGFPDVGELQGVAMGEGC